MAETIVKDAPVEDLTLEANKDTLQFTQGDLKSDFLISTINNNKSAILTLQRNGHFL